MNDLTMTVSGWVATDPKLVLSASSVNMCTFRLASTSRYLDRTKDQWVDGKTEWFSVRVFRGAATLVSKSITKGQPVIVTGRFKTNEWQAGEDKRTDLVLDATSVGHDLTRGVASFTRATAPDDDAEPRAAVASAGGDSDEVEGLADSTELGDDGAPITAEPIDSTDVPDEAEVDQAAA